MVGDAYESDEGVKVARILGIAERAEQASTEWNAPASAVKINCNLCGEPMWIDATQWAQKQIHPNLPATCSDCVYRECERQGLTIEQFVEQHCTKLPKGVGLRKVNGETP